MWSQEDKTDSSQHGGQAGTKCETAMKPRTQDSSQQGDHAVITTWNQPAGQAIITTWNQLGQAIITTWNPSAGHTVITTWN